MSSFHDVGFLGRAIFIICIFYFNRIVLHFVNYLCENRREKNHNRRYITVCILVHIIVSMNEEKKNRITKELKTGCKVQSDHVVALFQYGNKSTNLSRLTFVISTFFDRFVIKYVFMVTQYNYAIQWCTKLSNLNY